MTLKIAFLIYDTAAELDIVGPWDVFAASKFLNKGGLETYTVAITEEPVTCSGGLRMIPSYSIKNAPRPDILVVPGTVDPLPMTKNAEIMNWIADMDSTTQWTVGVCTGSILLVGAGVAKDKRVNTHWSYVDMLKNSKDVTVVDKARYVRDGKLVTSAGVTAGIDLALWLTGQLFGPEHARAAQHLLEYYPAPPYAADV